MHILKSLVIAFSIYSAIPVWQFPWEEKDMKYMLCFFPWVGAVAGICFYLWNVLCQRLAVGNLCRTMVGAAIPLVVTGGFHVDGFMDTMDAFRSYGTKEKKLEILKDSHIGAFAVIMLAVYGLLYLGAYSEVGSVRLLRVLSGGFFLSRCLSGISVVSFPPAKKEGMLYHFADSSRKSTVKGSLYLQGVCCIGFMLWQSPGAAAVAGAALVCFFYYYWRSKKEFGGITGDTAGFFILVCEGSMMLVAAVMEIAGRLA